MDGYCYYCMNKNENDGICKICGHQFQPDENAHHLPAGTILSEKYIIGRVIGEGGFGITYIGRDTNLDMVVAIKEYYPNGYVNRINSANYNITVTGKNNEEFFENGKKKFIREARILAKFSGNKSIVDVRDFFECNNTAYIVMEYIHGVTLSTYIKNNGNFEAVDLIQRMLPIFSALKLIHKNGLIHRDISPDNIMILQDGSLKLMDFGAAREVNFDDKKSLSIVLKHGYAPEEQYRSKGKQGAWTDIYAACATIYKCITGITPDESTERVYSDELQPPSHYGIDIPVNYEQALMKGLAVYQKDRYQSVDELIEAFSISESNDVSAMNVTDLSNSSDSDDKTEYYEENEETDDKTEYYSEDESSKNDINDESDKEKSTEKNSKRKRSIKRVILISIPSLLVICGLIITLLVFSSQNKSDQNTTTNTNKKETISLSNTENQLKSTSSVIEESSHTDTTTSANSKTHHISNETEMAKASTEAQVGEKFSIENAFLDSDGTNFYLSYSDTGYPVLSGTIDLSKYKNKTVSVTGEIKYGSLLYWDIDTLIEIYGTSGNVIVPVSNPQVSFNGYKELFDGIVIYGKIDVTEYFTKADLEQWGYNIQLYKTDVSDAASDGDMFTQLEGSAKKCNLPVDSIWASISEKAFAIKLPENIQPGNYTIYFQQYGDQVGWDSYIRFSVAE